MMLHHCGRNRPSRDIRIPIHNYTGIGKYVALFPLVVLLRVRSSDSMYVTVTDPFGIYLGRYKRLVICHITDVNPLAPPATATVVVVHSRFVLQSSHFVGILWAHSAKRIDTFSVLLLLLRLIHSTIRGGIQPRLVNLHKKSVHRGALSRDISHPFGKPFIYLLPCRGITENIPLFLQWLSVCGHLRGGVQLRKLQKGTAATANSDRGHEAVVQKEHRSANSNRIIRFCRTFPWPIAGN